MARVGSQRFADVLWWTGLAVAGWAGAALRLDRLGRQVLTGDELHGLNAALSRSVSQILGEWTYHGADYAVPLAAFYRALMDAGFALDETVLRAPVLIAGVLMIVLLPLVWAPRIGRPAALLLAWWLAGSPLLVLYSRIARSYVPAMLLVWLAVVAFERAWRQRSLGAAVAYVTFGAAAVSFHLGSAPLVGAPLVWAAVQVALDLRAGRARGWADSRRLAILAGAVAIGVAALLWPARVSLLELFGGQGAGRLPAAAVWFDVFLLQMGTANALAAALAGAAALRGLWVLARREAATAGLLAMLVTIHAFMLVALSPYLLESLVVVNRYLLFLLPGVLLLSAVGLTEPLIPAASAKVRRLQMGFAACVLAFVMVQGPLFDAGFRASGFNHSNPSVTFTRPPDWISDARTPQFYLDLPLGDDAILEYPAANVATHAFDAYQRRHRHPVVLGSINQLHADSRLALRSLVAADPDVFEASGARYVVVHLDLQVEEGAVVTSEYLHRKRLEELDSMWQVLRTAGRNMAERLRGEWGEPVYSDAQILVWDRHPAGSHPARSRLPDRNRAPERLSSEARRG